MIHTIPSSARRWLLAILLVAVGAFALALTRGQAAGPTTVYDALPDPLPPNVASLGFQATSTSEFGDYIQLAGTDRLLQSVTVTMSDWALYSDYSTDIRYQNNLESWSHPITLNIYDAVPGSPNTAGTLRGSVTQDVTIPWRPAADPTCPVGTAWRAQDTLCYNGLAFNVVFDMSSLNLTLPNDIIISLAYNTQSYGTAPMGLNGPYNSLNVGVPSGQTAAIGTDADADRVFWNTSHGPFYADGGTGGVGIFREDTNWAPNGTVAFKVTTLGVPPTAADQCKNDGWKTFNNPAFKNQGDCVSFISNGK